MLVGCGNQIPQNYKDADQLPAIYPDYTNVTVPINIAPLTFQIDGKADEVVARLTAGTEEVICGGDKIQPDADDWQRLKEAAKGNAIKVEVYAEENDSYYDESVIYDNLLCSEGAQGQCINCHNYQQYNPDRMQFHARHNMGGTIIAYDGTIKKVGMKNDSILSAGVYPAWHPWLKLIVYSTNMTGQIFHSVNPNKIEVFDSESDLIAYDVEKNEVTNIENDTTEMECFPFWAPDGKALYYCSAHFEYRDTIDKGKEFVTRTQEAKYNLYKKRFDPETMQFGPRELVFAADSLGKSATLPRISPDGRYLMFTVAKYGIFHIWHHDADLWMLDLQTGEVRNMEEINSPDTESYHSWSSNGRWVVFSSRRYDSNYTRPYIAHIDKNGHASKPFELPCANPDYHRQLLKSYNVPEFMRGPVTIKPQQFADALKKEAEPVKYVNKLGK